MRPPRLSAEDIAVHMRTLDGWALAEAGDRIAKTFTFATFDEAMAFMARCAPVANDLNHHPEWSNVYNRVVVELTTHDVDGLTELDFAFASRANELA